MTQYQVSGRHTGAGGYRGLVRGLAALVLLALLVIVPPAALVAFVGNPIPEQALVGDRLTDEAVIGMLAAVVWVAWAQVFLVVLIEAAAAIRGAALPRPIPLCGPQQQLARRLVLAAVFLLAGTTTASGAYADTATATPAPRSAAVALLDTTPSVVVPVPTATQPTAGVYSPGPIQGRDHEQRSEARAAGHWYTVQPPDGRNHDTLWDIAERHLGDGRRWKEIFELNRNRPQADGERLEVARLICPGWRLLLPAGAVGLPAADNDKPSRKQAEVPGPAESLASANSAEDPSAATVLGPPPAIERPPATPGPGEPRVAAIPPPRTADSPSSAEQVGIGVDLDEPDDSSGIAFGALTLGLSAVAAAGLTAELARRRRRAQRFRAPGDRLRHPAPSEGLAERQLRTVNAEITLTVLRDVLRVLADGCYAAQRPLPDVQAVLLNAESITLLLGADDADAIAPFAASGARRWTLIGAPPSVDDLEDPVDPFPALVSVGVADDVVVLVNLEAAGTLHVEGSPEQTAQVVQAMAVEIGTSVLCSSAELVLVSAPTELARLTDAGRTRQLTPEHAAPWVSGRIEAISAALRDGGQVDLADARARRLAPDLWPPAVLVDFAPADVTDTALAGGRYAGLSVVTTGHPAVADAWTLTGGDVTWRLDPVGIEFTPQRLPVAALDRLAGLLDVGQPVLPPAEAMESPTGPTAPTSAAGRMTATPAASGSFGPADFPAVAAAIPMPSRSQHREPRDVEVDSRPAAPRVLVLGPPEVVGAVDEGAPNRRRRAVELISYLAIHPRASQHQVDEALWPGHRVSTNTRNPLVSRARTWLGEKAPDQPYLAHVSNGGQYRLHADVTCDWHEFCELSRRGLEAGTAGIDDLVAALELVRGRPFLGVNPATYGWAEAVTQDMVSAIVDVAQALAELAIAAGDHQRARWAAARGQAAEPLAERLHLLAAEAAEAMGDHKEADRIIAALRRQLQELDPDDDLDVRMAVRR